MENFGGQALAWCLSAFPTEKIKHWRVSAENSGAVVLAWFAKVFTPETRAEIGMAVTHWFHIFKPYHKPAVALAVLVIFFRFCSGGGLVMIMKAPFRLVRMIVKAPYGLVKMIMKALFAPVKTMKAPGRNRRIPRARFESNPRGYFRDLRARK